MMYGTTSHQTVSSTGSPQRNYYAATNYQREKDFSLLPPANLSSPTKKYELKTPPHSTRRGVSSLTAINRAGSSDINMSNYNTNPHGHSHNHEDDDDDDDDDDESNHTFSHHQHLSVLSTSNMSNINNGSHINSVNSNPGLLSPEFSSPNLYEHVAFHEMNANASNGNNVFQTSNIDIRIISDSPLMDNSSDKENLSSMPENQLAEPLEAPKFTKKRSSSTIISSASSSKKSRLAKSPDDFILPEPHEMPEIHFEGVAKPPFSYASLIGMALLRAPERRLTLAEIYQWISDNFKYYKKGEVGWQNSIRHNLSLNKAFEKTEKSKEKKGHFWQIVSGYEHIYCNIKESKRNSTTENSAASQQSSSTKSSSEKIQAPSTPKAKTPENFDERESNVEVSTPRDTDGNINRHLSSTPQITYSHTKSMNYQPPPLTAHSRTHSRNPSTNLGSIPELNIQYSSSFNASINASPMNIQYDSPSRVTNSLDSSTLDFTSSFSCRSNFELSPLRPFESGPILEPITPNRSYKNQNIQLPSITKQLQTLQPLVQNKFLSDLQHNQLNSSPSFNNSKFKTPLKITSTPINTGNSSIVRKLWASPSYLDDFYTSPCFNNNNNNNNTANKLLPLLQPTSHINFPNSIYGSPLPLNKKRLISKANSNITNGYSTNEIFGIDVCTIQHDDEHDQ